MCSKYFKKLVSETKLQKNIRGLHDKNDSLQRKSLALAEQHVASAWSRNPASGNFSSSLENETCLINCFLVYTRYITSSQKGTMNTVTGHRPSPEVYLF